MDTNEANYQARLGQSSPQGVLLLPSSGLKSESHHTSVGNWVGGKKQRCASGARSAEQVSERRHSESARATSATLINYMHVHYNLISGSEREEPTCKYLSMSTQIILFQCLLIPIHTIAVCNTVAAPPVLRINHYLRFWTMLDMEGFRSRMGFDL